MIEVELKLQPKGKPQEADGLLWGGREPVRFKGLASWLDSNENICAANGGLIGSVRTYLFRPVCYDKPSCFVPDRFDRVSHDDVFEVSEFPDSMPVSITRLERLGSASEIEKVLELQRRKRLELREGKLVEMQNAAEPVGHQTAERMAEANERMRLNWYLEGVLNNKQKAEELVDSIRYMVEYTSTNGSSCRGLSALPGGRWIWS